MEQGDEADPTPQITWWGNVSVETDAFAVLGQFESLQTWITDLVEQYLLARAPAITKRVLKSHRWSDDERHEWFKLINDDAEAAHPSHDLLPTLRLIKELRDSLAHRLQTSGHHHEKGPAVEYRTRDGDARIITQNELHDVREQLNWLSHYTAWLRGCVGTEAVVTWTGVEWVELTRPELPIGRKQ